MLSFIDCQLPPRLRLPNGDGYQLAKACEPGLKLRRGIVPQGWNSFCSGIARDPSLIAALDNVPSEFFIDWEEFKQADAPVEAAIVAFLAAPGFVYRGARSVGLSNDFGFGMRELARFPAVGAKLADQSLGNAQSQRGCDLVRLDAHIN